MNSQQIQTVINYVNQIKDEGYDKYRICLMVEREFNVKRLWGEDYKVLHNLVENILQKLPSGGVV